jgi:hypothetical protein
MFPFLDGEFRQIRREMAEIAWLCYIIFKSDDDIPNPEERAGDDETFLVPRSLKWTASTLGLSMLGFGRVALWRRGEGARARSLQADTVSVYYAE